MEMKQINRILCIQFHVYFFLWIGDTSGRVTASERNHTLTKQFTSFMKCKFVQLPDLTMRYNVVNDRKNCYFVRAAFVDVGHVDSCGECAKKSRADRTGQH